MTTKTTTDDLLDQLDPDATKSKPMPRILHRVRTAAENVDYAHEALHDAVRQARSAGYSWGRIGMALGTSRQAAQQRFGE